MFKNFIRTFLFLIFSLILLITYLSVFGIKTNKFNELIRSQILDLDNRIDIELQEVFFKIKLQERSFALNSKDIKLFINKESQEFKNTDILISFDSLFNQDQKIKKIIINSKEGEIKNLLKFIRTYKVNIPTLYLENTVKKGKIIYDIIVDSNKKSFDKIKITGKLKELELNFLGKKRIENASLNFSYADKNLKIDNIKFNYENINFLSKNISAKIKNDLINIRGEFNNKINKNFASIFLDDSLKKYLDDKISLSSKSDFNIILTKKLKIIDYKLNSELDFEKINLKFKNINLKNYITNFENKIILKKGLLNIKLDNSNKINVKFKAKYILNENQKIKDISLNYSKLNSSEKYKFYIDLTENELNFKEINFIKKAKEEIFFNLKLSKSKKFYELENIRIYNNKNLFNLNNIKLSQKFKIINFKNIEAKFYNKDKFLNDILIKNEKNNIKLVSKKFDISRNIERSLKDSNKYNFFDIFQNLNSTIFIDIDAAKLDEKHNLNNIKGKIFLKKNTVDKANISAKFPDGQKFIYTKENSNGKKVTTIYSDIAKPFVKKFKFIKGFEGGKLDYTSTEIKKGLSNSELRIYDFKLQNMPVLTKLLSLASLQGIADLATGEGIRFNEFDMFFDNSKNLITINEIYALGPAISILMEGYVEKNKLVSLRGTLVPATTINKNIAKIPLLGNILVGDKTGEGIFGVSFKIKGHPDDLDTRVNPIKTLTPRFITRTLDKIKKTN